MVRKFRSAVFKYLPLLCIVLGWEILSRFHIVPESMLPSFFSVIVRWASLNLSADVMGHTGISLLRAGLGFLLSVFVGTTLGIAMAQSKKIKGFFEPLVTIIYPLPKVVLIPIFMIWLGIGHSSKVAVIFLGSLLPVIISSYNGARGVDHYLIWSAQNMGTTPTRILRKVIIPAALPDILSGIRVALAVSFILLVSAEMLAARAGLGYLIMLLGEGGEYSGMFAMILTISILGFLADRGFSFLMQRLLIWREGESE